MELHQWLDKAGNEGRATWLADQLKRSKAAVSLWREQGVPLPLIPTIAKLIGRDVSEHDMLKHAMRCKAAAAAEKQSAEKAA